MKKNLVAFILLILLTGCLKQNPSISLDKTLKQTKIGVDITQLIFNENIAYNINERLLVEVDISYPYLIQAPLHPKQYLDDHQFEVKEESIIIYVSAYINGGTSAESIQLIRTYYLFDNHTFPLDTLVGHLKIDEINGYSIYSVNQKVEGISDKELEKISKELSDGILFHPLH